MNRCELRLAMFDDVPAIENLIAASVNGLQACDYFLEQRTGALGSVFGVDRQLIRDGTYFVIASGSELVACGGWSKRRTLFGSDKIESKDDAFLDPLTDAACTRVLRASVMGAARVGFALVGGWGTGGPCGGLYPVGTGRDADGDSVA